MYNIILIGTEHHFIQVKQLIKHFDLQIEDTLIWFIKNGNDEWIDRLINTNNISCFLVSESWNFSELINGSTKIASFFSNLKKIKNKHSKIKLFYSQYSSDFSLCAINYLKPEEVILLDEGTASFVVCAKRKKRLISESFKLSVKSIYYKRRILFPKKLVYFTQYNLSLPPNDSMIKYVFTKEENDYIKFDDSKIAFLGSSMVEVNLLNIEYYMHLMQMVKDSFPDKEILYFPHRKEGKDKLERIRKIKFEVVDIDMPFEFYFHKLIQCPGTICSFFTPTIMNLESKYNNLPNLVIYKFDISKLAFNREVVEDIYEVYKDTKNVKLINLF